MTSVYERASPELEALLADGVREGVFPGAVAVVGRLTEHGSVRLFACAGRLSPAEPEVVRGTPYDLASLTKPLVAALALRLTQKEVIDLHVPVAAILPELIETPAGEQSLAALLSHRAGLAPWVDLAAGLSPTLDPAELRGRMLSVAARAVAPTPRPGESLYSDLGYLIAGEALARAARTPLDVLLAREVTAPLGIEHAVFFAASLRPSERAVLAERVAPTEVSAARGGTLRGVVHDENADAFGGIAGHAGLFGTADAVVDFGLAMLRALEGRTRWLDQALVRWALTPRGPGHVIGWDTKSEHDSSAGAQLSPRSFGHLGFTGTSIWCDPPRRLCAVLLTNRVHPTRDNIGIRAFRPRFHDRVASLAEALPLMVRP